MEKEHIEETLRAIRWKVGGPPCCGIARPETDNPVFPHEETGNQEPFGQGVFGRLGRSGRQEKA